MLYYPFHLSIPSFHSQSSSHSYYKVTHTYTYSYLIHHLLLLYGYDREASITWNRSPSDHQSDTCINRDLSDIGRSSFNHAIMRSWGDMWTHLDATMEIRRRDWRDREIVVHDHRAIMAHDHRVIVAINQPSPDQTAQIFCAESPYKIMFFPL